MKNSDERKQTMIHPQGHEDQETTTGTCCGHSAKADDGTRPDARDVAECPVMAGTTVIKAEAEAAGLVRTHRGQRYWLCCDACGPMFDADPDGYAA
ncbi:YHS domain family protein [Aeromicrobium marinum DSM 15272]|uniref:YHS domain family protein n=1 Tax=Aeromicrobium marinum DSM 15272 TaxID=585531 RepID=E2SCC0_9ACTN|nr:hypothetical protein [Aeromicrobium marinum]EFQ82873.1 YHS domain family protein [Aeromicrobium marinum DSM 15272]